MTALEDMEIALKSAEFKAIIKQYPIRKARFMFVHYLKAFGRRSMWRRENQ